MSAELTDQLLKYVDSNDKVDTLDLVPIFGVDHQKIVGALKSIQATDENLLTVEQTSRKTFKLTDEGQQFVEQGSHEARIFNAVPSDGISFDVLQKSFTGAKIGCSKAIANGWVFIDNTQGKLVKRKIEFIDDIVQNDLKNIAKGLDKLSDDNRKEYKKRKLLQEVVTKSFVIAKGPEFKIELQKLETDLTVEMLANGLWQQLKFKEYNFDAMGVSPQRGHLHPLLKVRSEFRQIFLEMGFSEMPTNNYIESSFWNFDALFQPQQHPARDAHDTFFLSYPEKSFKFPEKYMERVKETHSKGGYGSQGYGYDWKIEEAQKNLLRTHTTAVSARMLYKLANRPEGFKAVKYFSIDKVFRNETLDATHLAEFHQVEGVIADVGITLGDLIGTFTEFFKKLGITQLEFKPAYNPYTEPSMEIFCFHQGLNKWIEVGNSGMFRPEMLLPMGIPSNVNVIAWGLSLERPTMIKYGINNIRDLVGPKVDLQMVQNGAICRLDK